MDAHFAATPLAGRMADLKRQLREGVIPSYFASPEAAVLLGAPRIVVVPEAAATGSSAGVGSPASSRKRPPARVPLDVPTDNIGDVEPPPEVPGEASAFSPHRRLPPIKPTPDPAALLSWATAHHTLHVPGTAALGATLRSPAATPLGATMRSPPGTAMQRVTTARVATSSLEILAAQVMFEMSE